MTGSIGDCRVAENNGWYVDDQRAVQLDTHGPRWALGFRRSLSEHAIDAWIERNAVPTTQPLQVLDVGCDDGINMSVLESIFVRWGFDAQIVGSDYNTFRLSRLCENGRRPVFKSDLREDSFLSDSFDVVLCSHVLEHIQEDVAAMREPARIVLMGGLLNVAVSNERCAICLLRNHVIQLDLVNDGPCAVLYGGYLA